MTRALASMIATWFGLGRMPWASGTWGTLGALPIWWLLRDQGLWRGVAAAAVFLIGWWAAHLYEANLGEHDSGRIVVDEVAGMLLTSLTLPFDWPIVIAAFVAFRACDILKPFPAGWIDARVPGGLGVMLDDTAAALWALGIVKLGAFAFSLS